MAEEHYILSYDGECDRLERQSLLDMAAKIPAPSKEGGMKPNIMNFSNTSW